MMSTEAQKKMDLRSLGDGLLRAITVIGLLYLFLVGVSTLSGSFKFLGAGFAKGLIAVSSNPVLGLFSGMLATVLVQSSSVTTSLIVGLVASSTLPFSNAVPMIMGANLGTSVTNTLVSLGYVNNSDNFKKAFAAATVHDFFNILTVLILLPFEVATGFMAKTAQKFAAVLYGSASGVKFKSPIKASIKPAVKGIKAFITDTLGLEGTVAGVFMIVIAAIIIITALSLIVRTMRVIVDSNKGEIIDKLLSKNVYATILFGCGLTIAVQSSSITTSLLVPMAGAGILSLPSIMPVTVGANIGTTTTALLASMAGNVSGLGIALVHFLFNILGMLVWFVNPKMRNIPIRMAEKLGELTTRNRLWGLGYIVVFFFALPLLLTVIFK